MKASIQTKLLLMCVLLVLLTTVGISATYYMLTKQDKQRESRQRIQIAFDIVFDDFERQANAYTKRFNDFLQESATLNMALYSYNRDQERVSSTSYIVTYLAATAAEITKFGNIISASRMDLYGVDKRLLAVAQQHEGLQVVGVYAIASNGNPTFLPIADVEATQPLGELLFGNKQILENPLPPYIMASYPDDIPDAIQISPFRQGQKLGIRITAPVYRKEDKIGVLVGEVIS